MPNLKEQRNAAMEAIKAAETMDELNAAKAELDAIDAKMALADEKGALIAQLGSNGGEAKVVPTGAKSLGEHFVKFRAAHRSADNRYIATPFKAAGDPTPSTGLVATEFDREPVRRVAAPLTVLDLFPRKTISDPIYAWNVYSATVGAVGTTAEGATKNKVTYNYVPKTANLQKITGIIKVTEELFNDAPYIVDAINQDLVDDLDANRQTQAVATLLGTSGIGTATVAANATDVELLKAIIKAAADIEDATHIAPDAVAVAPAVWLRLRSAMDADNHFYAGDPFGSSDFDRLFGMTFVKSADVTASHVLVGCFARGAELVSKADGIRVDSTNSNDTDFEKNLVSIRAETREILAVKRPGCFTDITVA